MSIIYDALKKVEQSANGKNITTKITEDDKKQYLRNYLLYGAVVLLGVFTASLFFSLFSKKPIPPKLPLPAPAPSPLPMAVTATPALEQEVKPREASFVLNGIFFSENEGYALINNRIVKIGDEIEGATVVRITSDQVELKQANTSRLLTTNTD